MATASEVREAAPGDEFTSEDWNWAVRAIKALQAGPRALGPGLVSGGGDSLSLVGSGVELATSGAGGIPARTGDVLGSGEATLWAAQGRTRADSQPATVYNPLLAPAPPATTLVLGKWRGLLVVLRWDGDGGGDDALVRVRTTGTITARSGATPGTGSGVQVAFDGTSYSDVPGAITLKNPSACELASGLYGWARHSSGTTYEIV